MIQRRRDHAGAAPQEAQLAAIEELKRKGPGYQRDMKLWGYVGQGAIAVGCIAAATVSFTALGLPCVIGGAVSSAAINYWRRSSESLAPARMLRAG